MRRKTRGMLRKWQVVPTSEREKLGLIQRRDRRRAWKYRGKTLNTRKSRISRPTEEDSVFPLRKLVRGSDYNVSCWKRTPGARSRTSVRETLRSLLS